MAKKKTIVAEEEMTQVETFPGEDITPEDSIVPVYLVPLTEAEEAERAQWAQEQADRETEAENKKQARESALAKLSALGLTEQEIQAITS